MWRALSLCAGIEPRLGWGSTALFDAHKTFFPRETIYDGGWGANSLHSRNDLDPEVTKNRGSVCGERASKGTSPSSSVSWQKLVRNSQHPGSPSRLHVES